MTTAIQIVILLLGLLVYYKKPKWYMLYWMITYPILVPFLCYVGGISTDEDSYTVIHHFPGTFMYLNLWILIDSIMIRKKKVQGLRGLFITAVVLVAFFVYQTAALSINNFSYLYLNVKSIGVFVLSFAVLAINDRIRPDEESLKRLISFLIILETVGVLLNLVGVRFYRATFSVVREAFDANLSGTFQSGQALGDFMATLFLLICYYFFCKRVLPKAKFLVLFLCAMFCIISAGSRMCFAIALMGLIVTVFFYQKKHRFLLAGMFIVGYLGLSFLANYKGGDISSNEGLNRIVEGLSSFTQSKKSGYDDESTMRLSQMVLEDYMSKTPIIGLGLSSQGDDFDVISGNVSTVKNLVADAHLAFLVIDIGVLGVFLYLLFFYQMFRYWRKNIQKEYIKTLIITFVFFLIFSITEEGFWDSKCFPIILVFYFSLFAQQERPISSLNKNKIQNKYGV